jgi:hypothetical protein
VGERAALGPFFSFNVVELAAPALAAWTAYLLCRHLTGAFLTGLAGGFFFGFSPDLIDEFGMGHTNLSLVFLVPLAAYLVVRLLDGSLPARRIIPLLGLVLGAQLYISTGIFATLTLMGGVFALLGLAAGPPWRQRVRAGLGPVAAAYGVAAVQGTYRRYVRPHETVWVVDPYHDRQMIWQARAGFSFRLAGGFFGVAPPGLPDPAVQARLGIGAITGASVAGIKAFLAGVAGVRSGGVVVYQLPPARRERGSVQAS